MLEPGSQTIPRIPPHDMEAEQAVLSSMLFEREAISVAHDSHNIIATGTTDEDIAYAVENVIKQGGGVVLARNGKTLESMPLPIGGLISTQSGEWVEEKLDSIHRIAHEELMVSNDVEPLMTLSFMALPVIPELKLTDMGLFDVTKFKFISTEVDSQ